MPSVWRIRKDGVKKIPERVVDEADFYIFNGRVILRQRGVGHAKTSLEFNDIYAIS